MIVTYWIKTNLHKDGSPQWDCAVGDSVMIQKKKELEEQGYKPIIDHSMTERG
jgi:hypothetical protein